VPQVRGERVDERKQPILDSLLFQPRAEACSELTAEACRCAGASAIERERAFRLVGGGEIAAREHADERRGELVARGERTDMVRYLVGVARED